MAALVISSFHTKTVDRDNVDLPSPGTIIRAAYPRRRPPVRSSVSSHTSSLSMATPSYDTKHLGIVVAGHYSTKGYIITVYPILSFSRHSSLPIDSKTSHWKPESRQLLLPLPHVKEPEPGTRVFEPGFRLATTPSMFGDPLDCGMWLDTRPSWLWADPQIFELKLGMEYDVPDITWSLSASELKRISDYTWRIDQSDQDNKAVASSALGPVGRAGGTLGGGGNKSYGGSKFEPSNDNSNNGGQDQNGKNIKEDNVGNKQTGIQNLGTVINIDGQPVRVISKAEFDSFCDPYDREDWEPWECIEGNEPQDQSEYSHDKVSNWLQSIEI